LSKVCLQDFVASFRIWSFISLLSDPRVLPVEETGRRWALSSWKKKQLLILVHLIAGSLLFRVFLASFPHLYFAPNRTNQLVDLVFLWLVSFTWWSSCPASVFFSRHRSVQSCSSSVKSVKSWKICHLCVYSLLSFLSPRAD
jgi:hypothetical protein